jgi:acetylserotonin N-methyltransferase
MSDPISAPTSSDGPIWNVWLAAFHAPALAIADEIGLFPSLRDGPLDAAQVAEKLAIDTRAAEGMLGLMTALGFLVHANGAFHLTDVAREYLLPESPFYWGGYLKRIRDVPLDCKKMTAALRRGRSAEEQRVSSELWRAPVPPPEALRAFTHAMHAHSFGLAMRVMPNVPLAGVARFLDVAGGSGSYSIAALLQQTDLRCAQLDLPAVCDVAREYAERFGVAERFHTVAADMFAGAWPGQQERVFFSDVWHDWDDERCRQLARYAFDALVSGGRVLVHEMIMSDTKTGPLAAAAFSMVMVFVTEGRQRSAQEIFEILTGAGFVRPRLTMTAEGYALLEADKP